MMPSLLYLMRKVILCCTTWRHWSAGWVSSYTKLVPDMVGIDPDDAFSTVPYEKGHTLLYYLETLVGGLGKFLHQVGPRYGRNRSR